MNYLKRTWCDIDLNCLKYNIEQIKSIAKKELFAVVKANAYGHGDEFVSKTLQECGIRHFAVSNYNEARNLRSFGITGEILILGNTPYEYVNDMIKYDISQTVYDIDYAKSLNSHIKEGKLKVHIKIDTGMCRIGFLQNEVHDAYNEIKHLYTMDKFDIKGIFTHFSCADSYNEQDEEFTKRQINRFDKVLKDLEDNNIKIPIVHTQNSAGIINYDCSGKYTHARAGVAMYGLKPSDDINPNIKLKPILSIKTTVAMVKEIDENSEICYGRTFKANEKMKVATLTIGYADGYCRAFSNRADVLINGKRCRVLGRVCMDQTVVDVTGLDVNIGDIAIVVGRSLDEEITMDELALIDNTINYELVCGISCRVPRVYYLDGNIIGVVDDSIKY